MDIYKKDGYRVVRSGIYKTSPYWVFDRDGKITRFASAEDAVKHVDHLTSPKKGTP